MGARRVRAFAVGLSIGSWCVHAAAFPTSRLTYARGKGAEACPDETTVRQAVAARLGYDPFFAAAEKTIVARIIREREELRATVELVDDRNTVRGTREFKAKPAHCDELVATMALAISIAIDPTNPGITGNPPPPRPDPPRRAPASADRPARPSIPPPPPAQPPEADLPDEPDNTDPGLEVRASTALLGAFGTSPAFTAGVAASLGVRNGFWSLSAEGRSELPGAIDVDGGRVRTSLWAGAVVPCLHFDPLLLCATGWVGSWRAQGIGFPTSRTDHAVYVATGLRAGFEIPMTSIWTFRPEVDLLATLFPVDLQVDGSTQWAASRFSSLLRVGVVARFP